jgi:hypothetical protein
MDKNNPQGSPLAVEPQDEQLPIALITAVSVISLLIFGVGVLWAVKIQDAVEAEVETEHGPHRRAEFVGRPEIGIVDQTPFEVEKRAAELKASRQEKLGSAGWVSQRQGIVHIPITEAMQAVAGGKQVAEPTQMTAPDAGVAPEVPAQSPPTRFNVPSPAPIHP